MLFPTDSFKEHLQSKLSSPAIEPSVNVSQFSFLDSISKDTLIALINQEPAYFTGLLCHMLPKDEFASLLSSIPESVAQNGLSYYTKINPTNASFMHELTEYYIERAQQMDQKISSQQANRSKDIAQILELLPNSNKDSLKSIIPADISWSLIEDSLLNINDLTHYSPKEQQIILSALPTNQALAELLSILPSSLCNQLVTQCLTTRQADIVTEELAILKNPLSEETIKKISNDFIQLIRKLERDQKISELDKTTLGAR